MTIEERLEKVEKELAILKKSAASAPKEIRASSFIAVDENGKDRAVLNVSDGVPGLILKDENGKNRIILNITKNKTGLTIYDEKSKNHIGLSVKDEGLGLALYDDNGPIAGLGMENDQLELRLGGKKGMGRVILQVNKNIAGLVLRDDNDNPRALLSVDKDGCHMLALVDGNSQARATLRFTESGVGLVLSDEKGEPRAMLIVTEDGPALQLLDEDGEMGWSTPSSPAVQ